MQKLYLSNNNISSTDGFKDLPSLTDLTLENNLVERTPKLHQIMKEKFPSLLFLNLQKVNVQPPLPSSEESASKVKKDPATPVALSKIQEKAVSNNPNDKRSPPKAAEANPSNAASNAKPSNNNLQASLTKPKIESNVIKIIQREWEKEVERLDAKKNGYKPKQNLGDSKFNKFQSV